MMFLPLWRAMACITVTALGLTLVVTTVSLMTWELSVTLFPWSTATTSKIVTASLLYELLEWIHQVPPHYGQRMSLMRHANKRFCL
ncbi:Uncharacterised protein [Citrobacter amalonaticus]|nr:Uncharacterised protein [Citrobacter amalonaticus]